MKILLIIESAILGLLMMAAVPMWAMVPMFFGITEYTDASDARPIYILLILFPIITIAALVTAWNAEPSSVLRLIMMLIPILHIVLLLVFRIKQ
jgi:hypothetical protein